MWVMFRVVREVCMCVMFRVVREVCTLAAVTASVRCSRRATCVRCTAVNSRLVLQAPCLTLGTRRLVCLPLVTVSGVSRKLSATVTTVCHSPWLINCAQFDVVL